MQIALLTTFILLANITFLQAENWKSRVAMSKFMNFVCMQNFKNSFKRIIAVINDDNERVE